jgi:MFS family permease
VVRSARLSIRMSTGAASPIASRISRVDPNAVLAVVAVTEFMVILDASIVNVALPTIKRELAISQDSLSWDAYILMFGGFLLFGGRLADRLGRRLVFIGGIAVFSSASLVCGIAQSEDTLLVARGFQGLGAAMVSPAALSIIVTTSPRGRSATVRSRCGLRWRGPAAPSA